MSVVDESKLKLLKMRERLLAVSPNMVSALEDYRSIVCEIDAELFKSITDMIKDNGNYTDYPLEKQLEVFLDIESKYNDYYNFQESIRSTYKRYSDSDIELCDITSINVEEIRKRINSIRKYFDNIRIIQTNKEELDKTNIELINEEKRNNALTNRIDELDEELRQNLLKAEGRIYDSFGGLEYTSAVIEAEKLEIDLKKMLVDNELLKEKLDEALAQLNDVDERLKTAQICYNNSPNINYKEIYLAIKEEEIQKKYRYIFLQIISLISKNADSFEGAMLKRRELSDLIRTRIGILEQIGIKYLYDPFDRMQIKNQLEVIQAYGNNEDRIKDVVSRMSTLNTLTDDSVNENRDLLEYFKTKVALIKDDTPLADILSREDIHGDDTDTQGPDNNVVNVRKIPSNFKLDKSREKANGVINRVYAMMNETTEKDTKSSETAPQLVIEPISDVESKATNTNAVTDTVDKDDVFLDLPFEIEAEGENPFMDEDEVFVDSPPDNVVKLPNNDTTTNMTDNVAITTPQIELFQEVKPFDDIQLFDNKYDDGTIFETDNTSKELKVDLSGVNKPNIVNLNVNVSLNDNVGQANKKPDVFWTTREDAPVDSDKKVFDRQIEELVQSETQSEPKVRKLVS